MATELTRSAGHSLRWTVEIRDPSWLTTATFDLLGQYEVALCCHDLIAGHPFELTAAWGYARFHGPDAPNAKFTGDYGNDALVEPARALRPWLDTGHEVFAYFNNDNGGAATRDAQRLERLLHSR